MKLFRDDDPYISKRKWKQIFLAMSIMVLVLYVVAMICSLCGSTYFILNYQNEQMDRIEAWFRDHQIYGLINIAFNVIEFEIVMSFVLKRTVDEETYDEIEMIMYKDVYGCHFNKWLLEKATQEMVNEDGTKGGHWNLEQTTMVARSNGIEFKHFNEYDWNYVMNMVYSDYYGAVPNETASYVKIARRFLEDKDAEQGKALKYYIAMKR